MTKFNKVLVSFMVGFFFAWLPFVYIESIVDMLNLPPIEVHSFGVYFILLLQLAFSIDMYKGLEDE